jgi:hypothetical protein
MLFRTDQPDKTAPVVAALLQKELGLDTPPAFMVTREADFQSTAGGLGIREAFKMMKESSGPKELYQIGFSFADPQPWDLSVHVYRTKRLNVMVQKLIYSRRLSTHVDARVAMDKPAFIERTRRTRATTWFPRLRFHGDPPWAEKLNKCAAVGTAIKAFPWTLKYGDNVVTLPMFAEIAPRTGADVLTVETLPQLTWFGLKARLEPHRFLQLASAIEEVLGSVAAT